MKEEKLNEWMKRWKELVDESNTCRQSLHPGNNHNMTDYNWIYSNATFLLLEEIFKPLSPTQDASEKGEDELPSGAIEAVGIFMERYKELRLAEDQLTAEREMSARLAEALGDGHKFLSDIGWWTKKQSEEVTTLLTEFSNHKNKTNDN